MNFGSLLKEIRTKKDLTLAEVSDSIGLTSSSLSQIENGKIFPSILTLESILKYYRIQMSEFFRQMERSDFVVVNKESLESVELQKGISVSLLASKLRDNAIESYEINLDSGYSISTKELSSHINGERFVQVRSGKISVEIKNEIIPLQTGDSINYKSVISCKIKNESKETAAIFINGTPPVI